MRRASSLFPLALLLAGCAAVRPESAGQPIESTREAQEWGKIPASTRNARALEDHTFHNDGGEGHEHDAICAEGDGFTIDDATSVCGGPVKYFSYTCSDFPATPPYQPDDERAWTAYFGCCPSLGLLPPSGDGPPPPDAPGYGPSSGYGLLPPGGGLGPYPRY